MHPFFTMKAAPQPKMTAPKFPKTTWRLTSITSDDPTFIIYTFPEIATIDEVHEWLEAFYFKTPYMDWAISMETREVKCFIHKWRYGEWLRENPEYNHVESDEEDD